jgi:cytochrome c oxidase subunit III
MTTQTESIPKGKALELPRLVTGRRSPGWWGMLLLIANEAVIFAALIASSLYLRFNSPAWPQDGLKRPELILPAVMTVLLLSSSGFMILAQNGIKRGNSGRLRLGLGVAFLLALVFLLLQAYEYSIAEFGPTRDAYGSLFFTITGLHGAHVAVALLMNAFIQVRAWRGRFSARRYQAVENVTLYWHFVDVVWLVIIMVIYISPYW